MIMKLVLCLCLVLSLFMWRRHKLINKPVIYATLLWLSLITTLLITFVLHPNPLQVLADQRLLIVLIMMGSIVSYAAILYATFSMTIPSKKLTTAGWCGLAVCALALGWFKWLVI